MTNKSLKTLIPWKRQKDNQRLPLRRREDLLARWNTTKGQASPKAIPYNSTDKDNDRNEDTKTHESDKEGDEAAM